MQQPCLALRDRIQVAKFDLVAIPIVDVEHKLRGIVTYDDIFDVVQAEATEDAHRSAAVEPLEDSYLQSSLLTLFWKRGIWLIILFVAALLTALALDYYKGDIERWKWLVVFDLRPSTLRIHSIKLVIFLLISL